MNCQIFSTGLSSGDFGGSGKRVMLSGMESLFETCHPARSRRTSACAPGATASEISPTRFLPDAGPWLHCCRRVVRARRLFLRPGRWRRKYRPNSSSGRAAPKAVSRVSPIGGGPYFSALSELRLETKSLSACQEPLLRLSPPRGRESFFKSRRGFLVLPMMARSRRELAKAHMPQLAAERRLGDRDPELFEEPLRQIDQPPAHDAMQGGNRPIFHGLPQRP